MRSVGGALVSRAYRAPTLVGLFFAPKNPTEDGTLNTSNQSGAAAVLIVPHATLQMDDWFNLIGSNSELPSDAARELHDSGFVVIPGPLGSERLAQIADAYDDAVSSASVDDKSIGSTTTRVMTSSIVVLTSMSSTSTDQFWRPAVASSVDLSS
jgi:hypothetical protein